MNDLSGEREKPRILRPALVKCVAGILVVAGGFGFVWCYESHICMAGHMHHPPYPQWHYSLDLLWGAHWLLSGGVLLLVKGKWWKLAGASVLFLLVHRFGLGSLGGLTPLPI